MSSFGLHTIGLGFSLSFALLGCAQADTLLRCQQDVSGAQEQVVNPDTATVRIDERRNTLSFYLNGNTANGGSGKLVYDGEWLNTTVMGPQRRKMELSINRESGLASVTTLFSRSQRMEMFNCSRTGRF